MSAVPAAADEELPTRQEIENWPSRHLDYAAARWDAKASRSVETFEQHHRNVVAPGGTEWTGLANEAAVDRVTGDVGVVRHHAEVKTEAAKQARTGAEDIRAVKKLVIEAITEAEEDGFRVADDLSVADARKYDINTVADRNRAAKEHREFIRFRAAQLVSTDKLVGTRLTAKAAELQGIKFHGDGDGDGRGSHVQMVDNKTTAAGDKDKPGKGDAPDKPAEQATGQIGPFAVPKEVEDAAKRAGLKPPTPPADDGGLGALLGNDDSLERKPGESRPGNGLPPIPGNVPPPPPDKAAIDRQATKVESARQALAAAESKLNKATGDTYVLGPGEGPKLDDSAALAQSVFDARKDLTEQTRVLGEMSAASGLHGGPAVPIPPLPENADVQAFPPKPSEFERGSKALSDGSFGLIPDVAKGLHTFNNWDQASAADKLQATLDAAGLVPLPGMKLGVEGLEHVLPGVARHFDDVPMPHGHVDPLPASHAPVDTPAGHAPVDAPPASHAPIDAPVEHHAPDPVHDGGFDHSGDFGTDGTHHSHDGDAGAVEPRPYNDSIEAYPRAYHPGTGEEMPFPPGELERVPTAERSEWTKMDRYYYIKQWHDMGYADPPGGWDMYDIHHIQPREFGGDNSFENLIPVPRPLHNQRITPWWNNYGQG